MKPPAPLTHSQPDWKQEASRRLAEYRRSTGQRHAEQTGSSEESSQGAVAVADDSDAAQLIQQRAAARVAERFAQAPRYFELPAMRYTPSASAAAALAQAALKARAAAQGTDAPIERSQPQPINHLKSPLGFETSLDGAVGTATANGTDLLTSPGSNAAAEGFADHPSADSRPEAIDSIEEFSVVAPVDTQSAVARREEIHPARGGEPMRIADRVFSAAQETLATLRREIEREEMEESLRPVEPAQPIHANLITFPRELVATRKVRPRLLEGLTAAPDDAENQLSIFEVEPETISTEPAPAVTLTVEMLPDWSTIQLDSHPADVFAAEAAPEAAKLPLYPAPLSLRLISAAIDGAMVLGSFLIALAMAGSAIKPLAHTPLGIAGAAALLFAVAIGYQAIFFSLSDATPGMKYAGISLCTFDEQIPTRVQLRRRLGALLVSLLPVGLGLIWVLFDEDRLSWHDRLSRTYQRQN